jgi:hypothetical protein
MYSKVHEYVNFHTITIRETYDNVLRGSGRKVDLEINVVMVFDPVSADPRFYAKLRGMTKREQFEGIVTNTVRDTVSLYFTRMSPDFWLGALRNPKVLEEEIIKQLNGLNSMGLFLASSHPVTVFVYGLMISSDPTAPIPAASGRLPQNPFDQQGGSGARRFPRETRETRDNDGRGSQGRKLRIPDEYQFGNSARDYPHEDYPPDGYRDGRQGRRYTREDYPPDEYAGRRRQTGQYSRDDYPPDEYDDERRGRRYPREDDSEYRDERQGRRYPREDDYLPDRRGAAPLPEQPIEQQPTMPRGQSRPRDNGFVRRPADHQPPPENLDVTIPRGPTPAFIPGSIDIDVNGETDIGTMLQQMRNSEPPKIERRAKHSGTRPKDSRPDIWIRPSGDDRDAS